MFARYSLSQNGYGGHIVVFHDAVLAVHLGQDEELHLVVERGRRRQGEGRWQFAPSPVPDDGAKLIVIHRAIAVHDDVEEVFEGDSMDLQRLQGQVGHSHRPKRHWADHVVLVEAPEVEGGFQGTGEGDFITCDRHGCFAQEGVINKYVCVCIYIYKSELEYRILRLII